MNFDEMDSRMRVYETRHDVVPLPGMFLVARLDGRGFTKLTQDLTHPFDERFRDLMVSTLRTLMGPDSGFKILYGYTESDEISLLLDPDHEVFRNKERKLNSLLAGFASSVFTANTSGLVSGYPSFDCRISQLPRVEDVVDYFRWRQEDAARNSLNSWSYWTLRHAGMTSRQATRELLGQGRSFKHELLMGHGVNFAELPGWQKNGVGVWWETYTKDGVDPRTDEVRQTTRRRLTTRLDLPYGEDYGDFIRTFVTQRKDS